MTGSCTNQRTKQTKPKQQKKQKIKLKQDFVCFHFKFKTTTTKINNNHWFKYLKTKNPKKKTNKKNCTLNDNVIFFYSPLYIIIHHPTKC